MGATFLLMRLGIPHFLTPSLFPECQRTELGSGYRFLQKAASCSLRDVSESKGHSFEIAEGKSTTGGWFSTLGDHLENFKNDWHLGTSSHECDHNLQKWGACMDR